MARRLFTRMGYQAGTYDAEMARKVRSKTSLKDMFVVGPQMHCLEGIGLSEPVRLEFDIEKGKHYGEFLWTHQVEDEGGAMFELVVPLAITVLVVQNGQGIAVLKAAGHEPPVDAITVACGVGALASAVVGSVSTCLTGPTNAIITSSGERSRHYTAGIFTGVLAVIFGLLSPAFTRLMLHAPKAFIMALAGLAMLRTLQAAFVTSFKDRFTLGALVAFLVTVTDLGLLNIGAAFWGLLAGFVISWLLERPDFVAAANAS